MPTFFFDLRMADRLDLDDLGAPFVSVEDAYLDASRAVIDMSAEMLRDRLDPNTCVFEVRDAQRRLVLELPFREILRPNERLRQPSGFNALHEELCLHLARSRQLRADLRASIASARTTVEDAHSTVRRSRGG